MSIFSDIVQKIIEKLNSESIEYNSDNDNKFIEKTFYTLIKDISCSTKCVFTDIDEKLKYQFDLKNEEKDYKYIVVTMCAIPKDNINAKSHVYYEFNIEIVRN